MSALVFRLIRPAGFGLIMLAVLAGCATNQVGGTATPPPTQPLAAAGATPGPQSPPPSSTIVPRATETAVDPSVTSVVDKLRPSIGLINAQIGTDLGGTGSAWVYGPGGFLVTNAHVVMGSGPIKAHFQNSDGWQSARVVGISPCDDLAVLQVDGLNAPAVTIAASYLTLATRSWQLAIPVRRSWERM